MKSVVGLIFFAILCASCSLDKFLFNEKKLDHYDLSTSVIPESQRAEWQFLSGGNTLYGYYAFPDDLSSNGMTVLYCHGNKHHIGEYWNRVELLYSMGFRVFIFDYRGFGKSEGTCSQNSLYEDGIAALNFVQSQFHADSNRIILYGYSLGNVVSIYLASTQISAYALIAEAPFASGQALIQSGTVLDIPGGYVLDESFDNIKYVRCLRPNTKFLLLHGNMDDYIPYEDNGRVVYENAPQPKQLALIPNANHTDIPQVMGYDAYRDLINAFLFAR